MSLIDCLLLLSYTTFQDKTRSYGWSIFFIPQGARGGKMLIWRGVMGVGVIVVLRVSVPLSRTRTGVPSALHFWEFSCSLFYLAW
jgi:hypothetical protein